MRALAMLLLCSMSCGIPARAFGQAMPGFAAISIKPSADNDPGSREAPRGPGDYAARKMTLSGLLAGAYGIPVTRIEGAPAWWRIDRFDIEARYLPEAASAPIPPLSVLMQSLLQQRFGLIAHVEKRDLPVYLLRVASRDGRLGPALRPSASRCNGVGRPVNDADRNTTSSNGAPVCGANENPEAFIASGLSIDVLARALRVPAERDVINETGLAGLWDITLEFAPLGATSSDKPSVFTALQEQLGLKLESGTAPLDVLIVDDVKRPTAN